MIMNKAPSRYLNQCPINRKRHQVTPLRRPRRKRDHQEKACVMDAIAAVVATIAATTADVSAAAAAAAAAAPV